MTSINDNVQGKVLGGKTYAEEEIPNWWRNTERIPYSRLHITFSERKAADPARLELFMDENRIVPDSLPLNEFPSVEDFEVVLWGMFSEDEVQMEEDQNATRYHVRFFSQERGFLASFFYNDYNAEDLLAEHFQIPHGDFTLPYFDLEQGWAMLIAEREENVYILAGNFEELLEKKGYHTWFKVEKKRYYDQWEKTLQLCRETFL